MISPKNKQKENRVHRSISLPVTANPIGRTDTFHSVVKERRSREMTIRIEATNSVAAESVCGFGSAEVGREGR
jgi:hypothetical protein